MSTAGVSNLFIRDIFNRIKADYGLGRFFRAVLSCPVHSSIRDLRDELAKEITTIIDPIREESAIVEWSLRVAITAAKLEPLKATVDYLGPLLLDALSEKPWVKASSCHSHASFLSFSLTSIRRAAKGSAMVRVKWQV
jgi:hypothetical protein